MHRLLILVLLCGCFGQEAEGPIEDTKCVDCDEWADARQLDRQTIEIASLPAVVSYPETRVGVWTLNDLEHRSADGFPIASFDGGDDASERCMVAAAYRFDALFRDIDVNRSTTFFSQMMSRVWNGSFRNVVSSDGSLEAGMDYVPSTSSVLFASMVADGYCYLPTKDQVMRFVERCPSTEPQCDSQAPSQWAPARDVHDYRVDLRDVSAPQSYPAPAIYQYSLDVVAVQTPAGQLGAYAEASPASRRCLAASAYRFGAIFADSRARDALDVYRQSMVSWDGELLNLNEEMGEAVTGGIEHDGAGLVWRSQTAPDQTCFLPTYAMVMEFFSRCAGTAGCTSAMPDRWGAAGNVGRPQIDISELNAPPAYPSPRVSGYPMDEVEFRVGTNTSHGYDQGSPDTKRCAAAAAYRFEAILAQDEARAALVTFRAAHPTWAGTFVNVNEDHTRGGAQGARLETASTVVSFVSQTAPSGMCHLPTLDSVVAFLSR